VFNSTAAERRNLSRMIAEHTEYWVARPAHSTGFGFASVRAVHAAFEHAFVAACETSVTVENVHVVAAVPIDRRYRVDIERHGQSLTASMVLDDLTVAQATASLPYSSS
jgi:hypothetical protein